MQVVGLARDERGCAVLILAIDPGPKESGWCVYDPEDESQPIVSGVEANESLVQRLDVMTAPWAILAIEMIASYGMAVGKDVFETCVWVGRFKQAWLDPDMSRLVYRKDVKLHLCGTTKAKDANIRQALIDKLGPPGTKKNPGATYGVKSHAWAALAVAVYAAEKGSS